MLQIMEREYDYLFKVLLTGDSMVGKTCILLRFADNIFSETFLPTIGVDFKIRTIDSNGLKIKLQIWDTAGQERFRNLTNSYYRGCEGFIVVFDVSYAESFNSLSYWVESIEILASDRKAIFIVGNKSDLRASRQVSYDEAKAFAEGNGMNYIEVSALTGHNVEALFKLLTMEIVSKLP